MPDIRTVELTRAIVDKYKAKVWFQKAAVQGEQHAIEALNNLK